MTTLPSTASSLLQRVKSHDDDAWRLLVDLYGPLIYGWLRKAGLSAEDAADATQETFAGIASAIGSFQRAGTGAFRGWVWTIARRKLIDTQRKRGIATAAGGSAMQQLMAEFPEQYPGDDGSLVHESIASLVHRALHQVQAEFEPRTWSAFWQVVVDGRSSDEVGAQLDMSANSVRQARSRVMRRLRLQLGDLEL